MAFPVVLTRVNVESAANGTTISFTHPACSAGDRLLVCLFKDDDDLVTSFPSGAVLIADAQRGTGNHAYVYYRDCLGTEGGTSFSHTGDSEFYAGFAMLLDAGTFEPQIPPYVTVADAASGNANPPAIKVPWGAADTLCVAWAGVDNNSTFTGYPSGYSNTGTATPSTGTAGDRVAHAWCDRQITTDTEDPSSFANTSNPWIAVTIAIAPLGAVSKNVSNLGMPFSRFSANSGGGRIDLIRDGIKTSVGTTAPWNPSPYQWDDYHGGGAETDTWFGYDFEGISIEFSEVVFQEGGAYSDGGYFAATPTIEVRVGGVWTAVSEQSVSPSYNANNTTGFETYTFSFTPLAGDAIRVRGAPGGSAFFISVGELEAYGTIQDQDVTSLGTPVSAFTSTRGADYGTLATIKDGVQPVSQSTSTALQWESYHGGGTETDDWVGYTFGQSYEFRALLFEQGLTVAGGGRFTATPTIEVRVGGVWTAVSSQALISSDPGAVPGGGANGGGPVTTTYRTTTAANQHYSRYLFRFSPITGDGIRVRGTPAGTQFYISAAELRAIATASSSFLGTAAAAVAAFAGAAVGVVSITGGASAGAQSFAADATGAETFSGSASAATASFACSSVGSEAFSGTAAAAAQAFTADAAGAEAFSATATAATEPFASNGTGAETFTGTTAAAAQPFGADAAGTTGGAFGSATAAVSSFAASAVGAETVTGAASSACSSFAAASMGDEAFAGSAAAACVPFAAGAAGEEAFSGAVAATCAPFGSSGTGSVGDVVTGTVSVDLAPFASSSSGSETFTGSTASACSSFAAAASGAEQFVCSASANVAPFASAASGAVGDVIIGAASAAVAPFATSTSGAETFSGAAAAAVAGFASDASGAQSFLGSVSAAANPFGATGSGAAGELVTGAVSAALAQFGADASGSETFQGGAAGALLPFAAAGLGSEIFVGSAAVALAPFAALGTGAGGPISGAAAAEVPRFGATAAGTGLFVGVVAVATQPFALLGYQIVPNAPGRVSSVVSILGGSASSGVTLLSTAASRTEAIGGGSKSSVS